MLAPVKQEANGTWSAQVWYHDYNGDRRHKTKREFESEKEAQTWRRAFATEAEGSVDSTFASFFDVYKADIKPKVRKSTWATKEYAVRDKILPYFSTMVVNEIEPINVIRWQNKN